MPGETTLGGPASQERDHRSAAFDTAFFRKVKQQRARRLRLNRSGESGEEMSELFLSADHYSCILGIEITLARGYRDKFPVCLVFN